MQSALKESRPVRAFDRRNANLLLALLFWAFTYALFTYRAFLRYGDAYEMTSTIRLASTLVGAGLYWLVLSKLIDGTRHRPGKPLAVVATILPASIVVLLARVVLDQFGATNPNGFAGDLRFVMVWGGYFGLWVSASFVLRAEFSADSLAGSALTRLRAKQATAARQNGSALARAELLERLALEIATLPASERKVLMESFAAPAGYETADELEQRSHN